MKMITCLSMLLLANTAVAEISQTSQANVQENSPIEVSSEYTVKMKTDPNLGMILTDGIGRTLYCFKIDVTNISTCNDPCDLTWPPLLISSGQPTLAPGINGTLETIKRKDNTTQVTFNGMPLYYYINDRKPGNAYGHKMTNKWSVVRPR